MADSTIEWTQNTWNPTTGCTKISKECDNCYAEVLTNRMMHMPNQLRYKAGFGVFAMHDEALGEPYKFKKPTTFFVNSMSDLFHKDMKIEFLQKIFKVMNATPQHTYQVLTKRHHEITKFSNNLNWTDNIWMGVSVGSKAGVRRIEHLVDSGAKHKFLSVEPLLEELPDLNLKGINWVIAGGESGPGARTIDKEWVLKVKKNCDDQGVPFFFKQWGQNKSNPDPSDPTINKHHRYYSKGGCMLDGNLYLANPSIKQDSMPIFKLFGNEYYVMDDYEGLQTIWELKSHLPMMDKELYSQLKANISKNNLNDPILYITTEDGKKLVIEGHTRLRACIELKKKNIPTKEVKERFESINDIKLWMVKHQFQRRNLSNVEKIQLAYLSKNTIEKLAKENLSRAGKKTGINIAIDTNAEIAKIAGVGRTTVVRYNSVLENASKSIVQKLKYGSISISTAVKTIKKKKNKTNKSKPDKKEIPISFLQSIEDGKNQIKAGTIEGVIILNDKSKIEGLSNKQKKKYGLFFLE
ncbi:DUF5131 family protein [Winogradskyella sp.]|nr:DUF5131 family protein [Winogradskyella sp.]